MHTADELMEVVNELTSEHGGTGLAFKYAKRALELEPNHKRANEFMASFYLVNGDFSQAQSYTERLTKFNPATVSNHIMQGEIYKKARRLKEALNKYDAALRLSPSSPGLWRTQGELLSALGRHKEAADSYAGYLTLGGGPSEAKTGSYVREPEVATAYGRELYYAGQNEAALEVWQTVANMRDIYPKTKKEVEHLITLVRKNW